MVDPGGRFDERPRRAGAQQILDRACLSLQAARFREALARGLEAREQQAARERQEMNKRWGELANKMGTVVEDIVAPSIRRLAREMFDCGELRQFWTRMSASRSDDPSRPRQ